MHLMRTMGLYSGKHLSGRPQTPSYIARRCSITTAFISVFPAMVIVARSKANWFRLTPRQGRYSTRLLLFPKTVSVEVSGLRRPSTYRLEYSISQQAREGNVQHMRRQ